MKKIKLLAPIAAAATLGSVAPIVTLTSCGCSKGTVSQSHIESGENNLTIYGDDFYDKWNFALTNTLSEGQTLTCDLEGDVNFNFYWDEQPTTKVFQIYVVRNTQVEFDKDFTQAYQPTFTCYNSDGTTIAWQQKIASPISVTYTPFISFDKTGEKEQVVTSVIDKKKVNFEYKFALVEELIPIYGKQQTLECDVTYGNAWESDETPTVTVNKKEVKVSVTAKKTNGDDIAIGDYCQPQFKFRGILGGTSTWWTSCVMKDFRVYYDIAEVATTIEDLDYTTDTSTGYSTLKGIKASANADINTLLIPAKSSTLNIRFVGNTDESGNHIPLNNMGNIKKIKFGGLGVMEIQQNAFNGCGAYCIDLTNLPDTVKSLESMTIGTNAFALTPTKGKINWNGEFSQYKKHLINRKLYSAGLTSINWYDVKSVSTHSALIEAAKTGGFIQLTDDITISSTDYTGQINFRQSAVLDLNGHKVQCVTPIYNSAEAEFSVIGVWNCELLVTDTSANHDGGVYACEQKNLEKTEKPTDGSSNAYWENVGTVAKPSYKPRETRCFYIRNDVPSSSSAKGALEITAGKYYGNCTTVFSYNTVCYIEDEFSTNKTVGEYAPEFHIYTPYFSKPNNPLKRPTRELLNCKEDTFQAGYAYFDIYGGKFFGIKDTVTEEQTYTGWDMYDPKVGWGDSWFKKVDGKTVYLKGGMEGQQSSTGWDDPEVHPNYLTGYKGEYLSEYMYGTTPYPATETEAPYILAWEIKKQ